MNEPNELTRSQIQRQDFVDNKIHWLLTHLAEDINGEHLWNIEDVAKVREVCQEIIYQQGYGNRNPLKNNERDFPNREDFDMEFYPFLEEDIDDCDSDYIEDEDDFEVDESYRAGDYTECQSCHCTITWEDYANNTGLCGGCVNLIQ